MGFEDILGKSAIARILDYFTTWGNDFDSDISHIARACDLSWNHTKKIIKRLENQKIIMKTRNVGRAEMYKLSNNEITNYLVKTINLIDKKINEDVVEKELHQQQLIMI